MRLREQLTAVKEVIQHHGQCLAGRLQASRWWARARQPRSFWAAVVVLLLIVIGVAWYLAAGLLRVGPAFVFVVAFGILVARLSVPWGDRMGGGPGDLIFRLAASYVPAYLMFAATVDVPRHQDRNHLRPFLAKQTAMLAGDGQAVLAVLAEAAGHKVSDPPTQNDFDEICRSLNPSGQAPFMKRFQPREHATWIEFLFTRRQRSARAIERLFRYMTYLDSEHVLLITNIDDSTYFWMLDAYVGAIRASEPIRSTDLTFLANSLFRYYQLTRQLQQYTDRHFKGLAWSEPRG